MRKTPFDTIIGDLEKEETRMKRDSTRKTSAKKNEYEQLERERLFGPNIDHYMALNRCKVLGRVFHHAGPQDVRDNDIWEAVAPFIKGDELQNLLDELIPSKIKQSEFIEENSGSYRRNRTRDASDLLEMLYKDIANRKIIWEMLAEIMDTRVKEYDAIVGEWLKLPRR